MAFYMNMLFTYDRIKRNAEEKDEDFAVTIDDVTLTPPDMTVLVDEEDYEIGSLAEEYNVVHIDFDEGGGYANEAKKEININHKISYLWIDCAAYASEGALDNEEAIRKILKESDLNNIVPYTDNVLVKGLKLKAFEIYEYKNNQKVILQASQDDEEISCDIEQYRNDEMFCNYGAGGDTDEDDFVYVVTKTSAMHDPCYENDTQVSIYKEEDDAIAAAEKLVQKAIMRIFGATEAEALEKARTYEVSSCEITDETNSIYIIVQEQEIL